MKKIALKKMMLVAALGVSTINLTACTDEEVALGAGLIGGIIIGGAIEHNRSHDRRHDHGYGRGYERGYEHGYGHGYENGRDCGRRCRNGGRFLSLDIQSETQLDLAAQTADTQEQKVIAVAEKYQLEAGRAEKLVNLIEKTSTKNFAELKKSGLDVLDLKAISEGQRLSNHGFQALAQYLQLDLLSTYDLTEALRTDVQLALAQK